MHALTCTSHPYPPSSPTIYAVAVSQSSFNKVSFQVAYYQLFVKMSIKGRLPFVVLLFAFFFAFAAIALATKDPEFEQCKQQCRAQRQFDQRQTQECEQKCEEEQKRREREEERGRGDEFNLLNAQDPERKLRECQRQCEHRREEDRRDCQQRCQEEFRREQEERGGGGRDNPRDPERQLQQCKQQCQRHTEGREEQRRCEERCEREYREQRREGEGRDNPRDPESHFQQCKQQCQRHTEGREEQRRCEERCEREYREQRREGEDNPRYGGREEEEYGGHQQGRPYVFEDQHFVTKLRTEHGRVRVLQKFSERSELLRGIENYRVEILEAEPQTFMVPNHKDAEAIFFVAKGRGAISLLREDKRESFNIKHGDLLRVRSGTTVYLVNRDNNQKLVIVKLLQPVSTPGHFEAFFGTGGENPESYFGAFSTELLEAAFDQRREQLRKVFRQQRKGVFIRASEEQIRGMSHHEEGGIWPFGESKGAFNLFDKRPRQSNQYGKLYEVDPSECKELQELNLGVGFANITEGSMIAPYYNSKATQIAVVVNGEGYFEMACPHLSSSGHSEGRHSRGSSEEKEHHGGGSHQERQGSPSYQKVRGRLRCGTVFVVPAGHPVITVASKNRNLEIICFDVNAKNNEKFPLAGRKNIFNQMERHAKELAFGVSAREVDEVFKSQEEEFFVKGPTQQHEGRADA